MPKLFFFGVLGLLILDFLIPFVPLGSIILCVALFNRKVRNFLIEQFMLL